MKFKKSIDALNDFEDQFCDIIREEIYELQDALPLERFCEWGGFPDDDTIEIDIEKIIHSRKHIHVEFSVSFTEAISTSCADIQHKENGFGKLRYIIDKATGEAKELGTD